MISSKKFSADGNNKRFLSDFLIRSEQFCRVYVFKYDDTLATDGSEDHLEDISKPWSYPTNIYVRGTTLPKSNEDLITIDNFDLVDNSIVFYVEPAPTSLIYMEVATTAEEFGDTLTAPSVVAAEAAAAASAASEAAALVSENAAGVSEGNASDSEAAALASKNSVDARLDATDSAGNTVEENLETVATEPIKTQLANAESNAQSAATSAAESAADAARSEAAANTVPSPAFPGDEGLALVAHSGGNDWEKILGLPLETGNEHKTVTTKGAEGDSFWSPFVTSPQDITEDFTIAAGANASIVSGTIADGVTVTIPVGSTIVVL